MTSPCPSVLRDNRGNTFLIQIVAQYLGGQLGEVQTGQIEVPEHQPDIDRLWTALTADGGSEIQCGWLRDKWGVPWQIVPAVLPRLWADSDPAVAARVFAAVGKMIKLDIAALEHAASSG